MSHAHSSSVGRRGFLARLSGAAAGLTALVAEPARPVAASPSRAGDPDAWIGRLTGQHRVIIHAHQHVMTALVDARNMLANSRDLFGVPEGQFSLAVMTHGPAIQGLLRDDVWQRLSLGEFYKVDDRRTGAAAVRNVYLSAQDGEPADAAVSDLIGRGVTFVVCNVAVRNLATRLAAARGAASPDALHGELLAGVVPGAFVVPDLFVSMQRAQKRGVAYLFTDRPH